MGELLKLGVIALVVGVVGMAAAMGVLATYAEARTEGMAVQQKHDRACLSTQAAWADVMACIDGDAR